MVSKKKKQDDGLPPGWKLEIRSKNSRKFKCYIDMKTQKKFYSRLSMIRYIKDRSAAVETSSTIKGHHEESLEKEQLQDDGLPPGWKLEIRSKNSRKFKCYVDLQTQKKFYSRLSMLRYIKDKSVANKRSSTTKGHPERSLEKEQLHVVEANDLCDGLPSGWIVETKIRKSGATKGTKYKCFIDPATGNKFFSKPEVYRYLESIQSNGRSSHQKENRGSKRNLCNDFVKLPSPLKSDLESNVSQLSETRVQNRHSLGKKKVEVKWITDDDLPSGWIKEIRNKMIGKKVARSDPFYIDPASGLVFRSKPDALRYIRTGEISKHAYRRKKESISSEEFALMETTPPSSGEREKAEETTTRKQLFADEVSPKQCISTPPKANGIQEMGSQRSTRSSSRGELALVHEEILKQSTPLQPGSIAEETIAEKSTAMLAATGGKEAGSRRITRSSTRIGLAPDHEANVEQSALLEPAIIKSSTEKLTATGIKETGTRRSTRSSSRVEVPLHENSIGQPAIVAEGMNPRKSTEKIAVSSMKETGSRRSTRSSSKAGVAPIHEAHLEQSLLLQPSPIAVEMIPEKPSTRKLAATELTEGIIKASPPKVQDIGRRNDDTHWGSKPSTASVNDMLVEEKAETVALEGYSNEKARTSKRKMKDGKTPAMPSRSSKRLAGVDTEVVFPAVSAEHALFAISRNSRKNRANPSLGSIPSDSQDKPQTFNLIAPNGLASQEEMHQPLNVDTQTVLATPEDSSKAISIVIDIVTEINAQELGIDLEEYPPGFPPNPRTKEMPMKVDQSSVDPTDTPAGSKMEKSPRDSLPTERQPETLLVDKQPSIVGLTPEEQQDPTSSVLKSTRDCLIQVEQRAMVERDLEEPESQFSLSSPLWSDPCLEFAFKTLTGALPLDHNLAIEDYVQHQLRTSSEQSNNNQNLPDRGTPTLLKGQEPKPAFPFPENVSVPNPNSNGFGPKDQADKEQECQKVNP